jgi:hypothetical protein
LHDSVAETAQAVVYRGLTAVTKRSWTGSEIGSAQEEGEVLTADIDVYI